MARSENGMVSVVSMESLNPRPFFFSPEPKSLLNSNSHHESSSCSCVFKQCLENVFVPAANPLLVDQRQCGTAIGCLVGSRSNSDRNAFQSIARQVCSPVALYLVLSSQ